ncbi:MAG: molybdopterin molybdenumtransferase MoeA [Actinobacteria bacterium]|nr:molybdopterin molybdenumtransferase MoeA [Actinomycetota bacterium]
MSPDPVSVDQHLARILAATTPLRPVDHPIMDALGLAAAASVSSTVDLPPFDNSAMDGYAVRHADVVTATAEHPVHLPVVGEIGAGNAQLRVLPPGTAAKIMTGAPVPEGADAVVPYEWTDRGAVQVRLDQSPSLGQHIRRAGGDVTRGDLLIEEGTVLGPRHLGLLASVGRAAVSVRPRPRVVIVSTGSELRDPGTPLGHDSIYDGNSYLLAASARRAGAIAYRVGIVPDEPKAFLDALHDQLGRADVVVTSGGVSMGDYDVVKEALAPLGSVWFGPVAMQPGKPQGFGAVGDDAVPIFTLPGNPVSSYISFELFVKPALRVMMGMEPATRPQTSARLTHAVTSPAGKRQFLRGDYDPTDRSVSPVGGPGSHLVGDLAAANALIVVPEDTTSAPAGTQVGVVLLDTGAGGEF